MSDAVDLSLKTELCQVDNETFPAPKPIFGIPCRDECYDGEEFSVIPSTREWFCTKCPANFYSIGSGGILIDGKMGAFGHHSDEGNAMPLRMESSCQVVGSDDDYYFRNEECLGWTDTGSSFKAMKSMVSGKYVDFDLTYPVFFDEVGTIEFKFRKDSLGSEESGYIGEFTFYIDGQRQFTEKDPANSDWIVKKIEMDAGYHNLIWRYSKLNFLPYAEFLAAEIEVS